MNTASPILVSPTRRAPSVGLNLAAGLVVACGLAAGTVHAANDFPATPSSWNDPIYNTFGQFAEAAGGLHFHEATDIRADNNSPVRAPAYLNNFWVRTRQRDAANPYNSWLVLAENRNGAFGRTYEFVHLFPDAGVAADTQVTTGQLLGEVKSVPVYDSHLHFAIGGAENPWGGLAAPSVDPLSFLQAPVNKRDTTVPTIKNDAGDIKFRIAAHDRLGTFTTPAGNVGPNETHRGDNDYFSKTTNTRTAGTVPVLGALSKTRSVDGGANDHAGSADIDIVANAYDRWSNTGRRIGVQKVGFEIRDSYGNSTGAITSFDFSGSFLDPSNYNTLRDANLLRTVYSNDKTADSKDGLIGAGNGNGDLAHYYTLTNRDDDLKVQTTDRDRFWNSNVKKGGTNKWNTVNGPANANDAAKNGLALYEDGFYEITITASDAADNSSNERRTILLDNFEQTIALDAATYAADDAWNLASALNFKSSFPLNLYLMSYAPDTSTVVNGEASFSWSFFTDAEGELFNRDMGRVPSLTLGNYYVVADYNGDGAFNSELDAYTSFQFIPTPGTVALLGIGAAIAGRRRRA